MSWMKDGCHVVKKAKNIKTLIGTMKALKLGDRKTWQMEPQGMRFGNGRDTMKGQGTSAGFLRDMKTSMTASIFAAAIPEATGMITQATQGAPCLYLALGSTFAPSSISNTGRAQRQWQQPGLPQIYLMAAAVALSCQAMPMITQAAAGTQGIWPKAYIGGILWPSCVLQLPYKPIFFL